MKLLKRPEREVTYIDIGYNNRIPGRSTVSDAEIVCPDIEDPKSKVWNRLKYGTQPEFRLGQKIDRLEFPEDGLILHGIIPYEQKRTNIWEGCVFKCKVDHYEVI